MLGDRPDVDDIAKGDGANGTDDDAEEDGAYVNGNAEGGGDGFVADAAFPGELGGVSG